MSELFLLLLGIAIIALLGGIIFLLWRQSARARTENNNITEERLVQLQNELHNTISAINAQFGVLTETFDRRLAENTAQLDVRLNNAAQSIATMQKVINEQLSHSTKRIDQRMDATAQSFTQVKELLAKVESSNQRLIEVGKDVASLQDILTAPKLRGGFGELMLGDLLASMLPAERYELQHRFSSGEVVDAVIKLRDNTLISVDSKFPLENFKRILASDVSEGEQKAARRAFVSDVKKHVQAIAQKYIVPEEGTLEFALMYIPAENVYYETIVSDKDGHGLLEYFFKHRVIPVSPNSFYAYLMTIVFGLRGLRIEKRAREMIGAIDKLGREHERFADEFDVLGKHIGNAQKKYEDASRRFDRIVTHVDRIKSTSARNDTSLSEGDTDMRESK